MKIRSLTMLLLLSVPAGAAFGANSFSKNGNPPQAQSGQLPIPENAVTITQSTNFATVTSGTSVSCNNGAAGGFMHTDNSYYRAFTLASFNPPLTDLQFMVQSVSIGIETANAAGTGTTQPIEIHLFDSSVNPPTLATLGPVLQNEAINVSDQTLTVLAIPMTVQPVLLNASDILAVEVFTPNGQVAGHSFFIGSNSLGQSGPSFIRAASCGISEITNLASIGFASMHIVMTVSGNNQTPVELTTFAVD